MLIAIFISAEFHVKRCWIQGWLERVDLYENEIVSGENALLVCHLSKGGMENANCPDFYGDMELKTLWGVQSETCTTTVKSPISHPLSITIKFLSITRKDLTRGMGLDNMHRKGRGRGKDDVGLWVFFILNTESNCCVSPWGVNLRKLSNFSLKLKRNCSSFVVGHALCTWCVLMTLRADWVILGNDVFLEGWNQTSWHMNHFRSN